MLTFSSNINFCLVFLTFFPVEGGRLIHNLCQLHLYIDCYLTEYMSSSIKREVYY